MRINACACSTASLTHFALFSKVLQQSSGKRKVLLHENLNFTYEALLRLFN